MNTDHPFGEVTFAYTRAQAIKDGVLIDLSQIEIIRRAWKFPFACTSAVWEVIDSAVRVEGNDLEGILHDIIFLAQIGIKLCPAGDIIVLDVRIGTKVEGLKLHIGPGDTADPVLTLMRENED